MNHTHPDSATLGVHGMALVGEKILYLSHLPMFMEPHNFQVILAVSLDDDATDRLGRSRSESPERLYTFAPEEFHITELVSEHHGKPSRTEFSGRLVRGHFERGGEVIAPDATARVSEVAYFRRLDPVAASPDASDAAPVYLLFGKGDELFLAHYITRPPDFDQLLSVRVEGLPDEDVLRYVREQTFTDADRLLGLEVTVAGRRNVASERLKPGEKVSGSGHVTGAHMLLDLEIEGLSELYFEEGELAEPATFKPTEEETAAGFGE